MDYRKVVIPNITVRIHAGLLYVMPLLNFLQIYPHQPQILAIMP